MAVGFGWLGVGVGLAGCLAAYFISVAGRSPAGEADVGGRAKARAAFMLTLVLTAFPWLVAMIRREPFSTGQTLGWGLLIGGVVGATAGLLSSRLGTLQVEPSSEKRGAGRVMVLAFLALFGASLTYALFHGYPQMALLGFCIGSLVAGVLSQYTSGSGGDVWTVFSVLLGVSIILAVEHFNSVFARTMWPLPILLASTVLVAVFIGSEIKSLGALRDKPASSELAATLVALAVVLGLSALYSNSMGGRWEILTVTAIGMGIALLVWWLGHTLLSQEASAPGLDVASLSVLLAIAFVVAEFKLWAGLGIALGLIAGWTVILPRIELEGTAVQPSMQSPVSSALGGILALGLVVLLFRLFIESYRVDLGTADLRIHYTFIGGVLGAILPFSFVSLLQRLKVAETASAARGLTSAALVGFIAAAVPVLLYLVWDVKVILGLMFGLVAATAFLLMIRLARVSGGSWLETLSATPLTAAAQLSAIVFVGPLADVGLTRAVRIWILAAAVLVALVWLVAAGLVARRRAN